MKKIIVLLLVVSVLTTAAFADPVGLTAKIDSFNFGNVRADDYEFSGANGRASVTPGLDFSKSFGDFTLSAGIQDTLTFSAPLEQDVRLHVKGAYALQLAESSKLTISLYDEFHLKGKDDAFANVNQGGISDQIGPGIKFEQTLDFGSIYVNAEVDFDINFQDGQKVVIASGADDGFKVGMDTNFGLCGYVQPAFTFTRADGKDVKDVLTAVNIRAGYMITPSLNARVTFGIPAVADDFKLIGLTIQPRVTYSNIIPGLDAYADFKITDVGGDSDVGFIPAIGVSYAF
jgi:hypothetical protein